MGSTSRQHDDMGLFLIPQPMPYYRQAEHSGSLKICLLRYCYYLVTGIEERIVEDAGTVVWYFRQNLNLGG